MITDYLKLAVQNLFKRRLRSWLTMVGIFIGVSLLVALVSLGQGLQKSISDEFEKLGADKLFIQAKGGFGDPSSNLGTVKLTDSDVKAVMTANGVIDAVGIKFKIGEIRVGSQRRYAYVTGWPRDSEVFEEMMSSYDIEEGRRFRAGDTYKTILGHLYLDGDIFKPNLKLRDKVDINGKEFRVVGFLSEVGNSGDDTNIYIPEEMFDEVYPNNKDEVGYIIVKADQSLDPEVVAENIERTLRKHRGLEEGKEDFTVQTSEDLMSSFNTILNIVQVFLIAIAGISLLVGGIGITNTMYTAVLERTKEIGIMKAIGARNSDILTLFLIESGLLGLAGGSIGILIGIGVSKLVEFGIHQTGNTLLKAYFPWYLILGALAFSYVIGTLSGITPAIQASRQKPVDSLRYE
ncbi:ABC transporter permease [Candidatus Woesearchaeota archaeon]|nr:MAG: ABC transporter permease [Candidatus Woesearchaeota archaeon]